jgi:hypothetical protein
MNFKLYEAAIDADTAFTVELCRVYGTKAGDARYLTKHDDAGINAAKLRKLAADVAWLEEMKQGKQS